MNVDVENTANKKQTFWIQIYKVIDTSYFAVIEIFPKAFLYQCRNGPNKPQNTRSEVKVALKKIAMKQGLYA